MVDLVVRGSAWLALAAFATAQLGFRRAASTRSRGPLVLYRIGAALLGVHILAVFHWHHGWSHARAVAATAVATARVFGVDWGGGVWVNYAFLAGWVVDAWRRTRGRSQAARPSAFGWLARAATFVIIANGAIVFVPWPRALLGVPIVAALAWAWRPARSRPAERAR